MQVANQQIVQIMIAYVCVGVFAATAVAAVLNLFNVITLDVIVSRWLFRALIAQVVIISIAYFSGLMDLHIKVDENVEPGMAGFLNQVAKGKKFTQCGEKDECKGTVLACRTTNDTEDVEPGIWLWRTTGGVQSRASKIEYRDWTNYQCNDLKGKGWAATIGTCGHTRPDTPGGQYGWQRCDAVLVLQ